MKPDILYLLRDRESKWNDGELRFSLRSLKNFPHGRVFIASGRRPEWLTGVEFVDAADSYENKLANAVFKIRTACRDPRISEKFVLMNDDFFFLRGTPKLEPYTLITKGKSETLAAMEEEHATKAGYYFAATTRTRRLLQDAGITRPLSYEMHYPIELEKEKFLAATDTLDWEEHGYLFRSVYGNTYGLPSRPRADFKTFTTDALERKTEFLSISDKVALFARFQKFIFERFPEPSPYELPESAPAILP